MCVSAPLTIAVLQLRAFDLADHEHAWNELLRRIDDAAAESPRLIVAPEASYPASMIGSAQAYADAAVRGDAEVLATLGDRARRHGCWIAVGLVLRDPFGTPQNAAVLIAPGGAVVARAIERAPASWFAPGGGPARAVVDDVPIALFAGSDALDAASAAEGARVLIATGAASTWGRALDRLPESPAHVLLAARAVESGAWAVAPGKVGLEAGSRVHAGRAGIVGPDGVWVARAPSDRAGVALHTITAEALDAAPRPASPLAATGRPSIASRPGEARRAAVVATERTPSAVALMEALRARVRAAATQGAMLVVLPDLAGADTRAVTSAETLPLLEALSEETGTTLVVAMAERGEGTTHKTAYVIERGRRIIAHRQSHLSAEERAAGFEPGREPPPVIGTPLGRLGLLCGVEALVPSLTYGLVERGATLIAWCAGDLDFAVEPLARARAIEAGRAVLVGGMATDRGGASIIDARGTVLATTLDGRPMTALADLRSRDRRPGALVSSRSAVGRCSARTSTAACAAAGAADDRRGRTRARVPRRTAGGTAGTGAPCAPGTRPPRTSRCCCAAAARPPTGGGPARRRSACGRKSASRPRGSRRRARRDARRTVRRNTRTARQASRRRPGAGNRHRSCRCPRSAQCSTTVPRVS